MRIALGFTLALVAAWLPSAAAASTVTLHPADSHPVAEGATTPALPPKLDLVLMMDTTGSMGGAISNAKVAAVTTYDSIVADAPNSMFAVAAFDDYPYSTYGSPSPPPSDLPCYLPSDLTTNRTTWLNAVNSLTTHNGVDTPEAQVSALDKAASGAALTWPSGSVAAGNAISFRAGAAHIIGLVSDAPFHNDKAGNDLYSFTAPSYANALTALGDVNAHVI